MDRTGCHGKSHYYVNYMVNEQLANFFRLDNDVKITLGELDDLVINYAETHNGVSENESTINYDEGLWNLFNIAHTTPFKIYQIEKYVRNFITRAPCLENS